MNLILPWHCVAEEKADLSLEIINGHNNKHEAELPSETLGRQ